MVSRSTPSQGPGPEDPSRPTACEDVLAERSEAGLLTDLYGSLLTDRQRALLRLYYEEDLSLGEIASETGVSRQAVHDLLRRSLQALQGYERRLGLARRLRVRQDRATEIRRLLRDAERAGGGEAARTLLRQVDRLVAAIAEE